MISKSIGQICHVKKSQVLSERILKNILALDSERKLVQVKRVIWVTQSRPYFYDADIISEKEKF